MPVIFVDGPDGVGKTGYSTFIAREKGWPRLEMRPVDSTEHIEEKSRVFNAVVRDLHEQDVDLVVDRGSVSSIVYSALEDRRHPDHAWATLEQVEPTILYLRCEPRELGVRYGNNDELFTEDEIRKLAELYDEKMAEVAAQTGANVVEIDTSSGALDTIETALWNDVTYSE